MPFPNTDLLQDRVVSRSETFAFLAYFLRLLKREPGFIPTSAATRGCAPMPAPRCKAAPGLAPCLRRSRVGQALLLATNHG